MDEATFEDPERTVLSKSNRKPEVPSKEAHIRHKKDSISPQPLSTFLNINFTKRKELS